MKTLFLALLFCININHTSCNELNKVRNLFKNGIDKKELAEINRIYDHSDCSKITPYYAVAIMKNAEFTWSPIKKLSYFKQGKEMLEAFIKKFPNNIEARYVRWLTQTRAPKFLEYYNELETDYTFIIQNIANSSIEKDYQKFILNNIEKIKNE